MHFFATIEEKSLNFALHFSFASEDFFEFFLLHIFISKR
jgi:hypothetical protein